MSPKSPYPKTISNESVDPDPDQVSKEPEVISNGSMAFDNTKVYDHISIFNGLLYETTGKKDPGRLS